MNWNLYYTFSVVTFLVSMTALISERPDLGDNPFFGIIFFNLGPQLFYWFLSKFPRLMFRFEFDNEKKVASAPFLKSFATLTGVAGTILVIAGVVLMIKDSEITRLVGSCFGLAILLASTEIYRITNGEKR